MLPLFTKVVAAVGFRTSLELRQEQTHFAEEVAETLSLLPNCDPAPPEEERRRWPPPPPSSKPWLLPSRAMIDSVGPRRCCCSSVERTKIQSPQDCSSTGSRPLLASQTGTTLISSLRSTWFFATEPSFGGTL